MSTIFRPYNSSSGQRSDRSAGDRLRHRQKVREAIRNNIADIIAEESIIGKDHNRIIKVPIRGVKEYRFIYGDNAPGVGQGGDGEPKPGDVVGQGEEGKGRTTGRQPARRRLLRDRCQPGRTDRSDVRGSRAARSRTQAAAQDRVRAAVPAKRLSPQRHPRSARQKAHGAFAGQAQKGDAAPSDSATARRIRVGSTGALSLSQRRSALSSYGDRHPRGIQRRGAVHHGHLRLHGHHEEISVAQFFLPALSIYLHALSKRRDRLHRAPHRGPRGHRRGVLSQRRIRRHYDLVGLHQSAGDHRAALPPGAVERLRVSLLRRRQLRVGQSSDAQSRPRTCQGRQFVRLWRDQTARLRLLWQQLDQFFLADPGAQLSRPCRFRRRKIFGVPSKHF